MTGRKTDYGGKGAALQVLQDAGFDVPHFIVLPLTFFEKITGTDPDAASVIIARCRPLMKEWTEKFSSPVAVRSSALVEDSSTHSFAGQFKTLLNVAPDAIPAAVAEVWLSAGSSEAYAAANAVSKDGGMAVIIQNMVPASAAGVAFSAHPVNGTDQVLINAVQGLGEKLVDGSSNSDAYLVSEETVLSKTLHESQPVLTDVQILRVARLARKAHAHFGSPQDIEFAFDNDRLCMLQSRPITTLPAQSTIWDNSNIVESYPGLTQPLTYTFIRKMYDAVYRQFSALLGVPASKIDAHGKAFANMLGLLNGRVYYNLNSWYEALALLPGYSLNAAFMERMMGVREKPQITIGPDRESKPVAWWNVLMALKGILKNLRSARKQAAAFERSFNAVYEPFAAKDLSKASLAELWSDYGRFESLMLREWKAPLVNDFFAMIYFGLLQKQCAQLAPEDPNMHNRLLAGSDAVLTTQPMKELPKIANTIIEDQALTEIATNSSAQDLVQALAQPQHREAGKLFREYVEVWGERAVAELKLETITYQQEPALLAGLLQSYIQSGKAPSSMHGAGSTDREVAEAALDKAVRRKWIKRRIFDHILRNARYFVSQRENLRYYRTRGFGMVRRMMIEIGRRLEEQQLVGSARDVFWLELEEIRDLATEHKTVPMQEIIAQRKRQYEAFGTALLPPRVTTYGPPKGLINLAATSAQAEKEGELHGLPCSAGIVRAPVRVITYSDELRSLDGAILATYATDPGFVVLFASASGILTERGSLLSHAAIVSREMGIPCIVGIEGLMQRLKDGDIIEMNGSTGELRIVG
jgi:phosphohistidine swiveling domain-containing protein